MQVDGSDAFVFSDDEDDGARKRVGEVAPAAATGVERGGLLGGSEGGSTMVLNGEFLVELSGGIYNADEDDRESDAVGLDAEADAFEEEDEVGGYCDTGCYPSCCGGGHGCRSAVVEEEEWNLGGGAGELRGEYNERWRRRVDGESGY